MSTVERKYVLSKIGPGDYLLPSNDASRIWRIVKRHSEAAGEEAWAAWLYDTPSNDPDMAVDTWDWERWEHRDGPFHTRKEAIDAALTEDWAQSL